MILGASTSSIKDRPSGEEVSAQVEAILACSCLQNCESSRRLLAYLAQWSQEHVGQHLKESEIAFSVFQRRPGEFDPQTDSVVRVQMARLRKKIGEYYLERGEADEILIDIPKGSYALVATRRMVHEVAYLEAPVEEVAKPMEPGKVPGGRWYVAVALLLCGVGAGMGAMIFVDHGRERPMGPNLRQFWSQLLQKGTQSVVVFTNPRLAGTLAVQGLHYFQEGVDSQDPSTENYSYTGAGDVEAASALTRLFDALHLDLQVRSGALLSWGQAKESNLIFIGRPEQNPALQQLPRLPEFYFKFHQGIVNAHPRPGEREIYECSKRPYSYDYAVIALIPGLNRNLNTLVLAGNTTYGSLAAAEFVVSESSMATLLSQLGVARGKKTPYFEALLEVRINNETPVWSKLIAQRTFSADQSSWKPPLADER